MIQDPKIILCDEPIASLDPKSSRMVMEHLCRVTRQHGIACVVNLHQVDFALEFSDRIIGLREGEKVFEGTPDEVTPQVIARIYEGDEEALVDVEVAGPAPLASGVPVADVSAVGVGATAPGGAQ